MWPTWYSIHRIKQQARSWGEWYLIDLLGVFFGFLLCESFLRSGLVLRHHGLVALGLCLLEKSVGDVGGVVHAQPNADDQQHRGGRVQGQAPEVHEPHHIDQGEDDADQDEDGAGDVGEHEDHDDEHAGQGKDDAPEQLDRKDPFNLPELVSGKKPKSSESVYN